MIQRAKKLRPPQMWWVMERQARRRRETAEMPVPAVAEWSPRASAGVWFIGGAPASGDADAFALVDQTTVTGLDLTYAAITSISGLEALVNLEMLNLSYNLELYAAGFPTLPASLQELICTYAGFGGLPDFADYPTLRYINVQSNNLDDATLDALCIQLDNNGLSDGYLYTAYNPGTTTVASLAARTSLAGKGWDVY